MSFIYLIWLIYWGQSFVLTGVVLDVIGPWCWAFRPIISLLSYCLFIAMRLLGNNREIQLSIILDIDGIYRFTNKVLQCYEKCLYVCLCVPACVGVCGWVLSLGYVFPFPSLIVSNTPAMCSHKQSSPVPKHRHTVKGQRERENNSDKGPQHIVIIFHSLSLSLSLMSQRDGMHYLWHHRSRILKWNGKLRSIR